MLGFAGFFTAGAGALLVGGGDSPSEASAKTEIYLASTVNKNIYIPQSDICGLCCSGGEAKMGAKGR